MQIFDASLLDETLNSLEFKGFDGISEFTNVEFNNCLFKGFVSNNIVFENFVII